MTENYLPSAVYTLHQLEQLGQVLASRHKYHKKSGVNSLLTRLRQNEEILRTTYKLVTISLIDGHKPTPAGEWLLDNFHLIEDQIRTSKRHLPPNFCKELPTVEDPNWQRQPRIYLIARELINHTDGRLDADSTMHIVQSYQVQTELKLGELWAFPIMLRLALIDNLRTIAEAIASSQIDQQSAKFWAEKLSIDSNNPQKMIESVTQLAASEPRLSSAFVSEFSRRMQIGANSPSMALTWLEQKLGKQGSTIENHQNLASQDQAHDQMSMSNSIASLRFLNETDWRVFVEAMSGVNTILKKDPSDVFSAMDFATRDSYRHVIEYIAHHSIRDESAVAQAAINLSQIQYDAKNPDPRSTHVGEYLLGSQRQEFERLMGVKYTILDQVRNWIDTHPFLYYTGLMFFVIAILLIGPFRIIWDSSLSFSLAIPLAFLLLFPASQCGIDIVNWLTVIILRPKVWNRMDFSSGIPDGSRTIVVVPCMLTNLSAIGNLIEDLEVRYLGNRDPNILFSLLSDFVDAEHESEEADMGLLECARSSIQALNAKYMLADNRQPFYLFHRYRTWNPTEGLWMGYERKRGKLAQLNEYLRSKGTSAFYEPTGDLAHLHAIRYVLTLDTDSSLPRETACKLIETMAHPLNRPCIDEVSGLVKTGYAILQPRVTVHLRDSNASHFTRLFSDDFGIDPYTKSVSDVYQDLFHEGSFIGKGIYDIDAFDSALKSRFPENRVLSHDLIESGFARSGLVSDVRLVEEYPKNYASDAGRRHRWIRGDWQIAAWLLPKVPDGSGTRRDNPLSKLSRWKIFDNLRRSITPVGCVLILFISWIAGYKISLTILGALLVYLALPHSLTAFRIQTKFASKIAIRQVVRDELRLLVRAFAIAILNLVFLPYEAYLSLDASLRSFYRLLISKKKLLEWRSSAEDASNGNETLLKYVKLMWIAPLAAAFGFCLVIATMGHSSVVVFPLLVGWLFAPSIGWWMSQPIFSKVPSLSREQVDFLRIVSRKTWLFFDTFLTAKDNWLPPDNFQEYPSEVVAHRTSPTNIGLSLLSCLGAYDFAYISLSKLIHLSEQTFQTLDKMQRFRGHFFNWYDTQTLKPLGPLYISTVDSGNLQGALLVLAQGFEEIAEGNLRSQRMIEGLEDGLLVIEQCLASQTDKQPLAQIKIQELKALLQRQSALADADEAPLTDVLSAVHTALMDEVIWGGVDRECAEWVQNIKAQIQDHLAHLEFLNADNCSVMRLKLRYLALGAREMMKKDYSFLYNKSNKLLSIGFNVTDSRLDHSYYDLLASEARLASFLAIADGTLPQEHWFALGRQLTYSGDASTLLSWSGSMFEYLMPLLIMPNYDGTLLNQACRQCIQSQIKYGRDRNVPWGISESAYNLTDSQYNYQYRAFGVPGLGFKRGLEHDLVIAPYATVMSLMLEPKAACLNLQELAARGFTGKYGFYEAIDYTPSRVPAGEDHALIRSFMVHHQGMSFLALLHYLLGQPMQSRMANDSSFRATELLLHERVPKMTSFIHETNIGKELSYGNRSFEESFRVIKNPSLQTPEVHLLNNGNYHVVLTSAGSGYSSWKGLMLTRWREDRTQDASGYFIYIKDVTTSKTWSAGFQPTLAKADNYEVIFSEGRGEIRRSENGLGTHLEVAVSPDDDAELRRLTISNHSSETKVIEITTYAEVILTSLAADMAHPAFSNLFIESEIVGDQLGIVCKRRAREPDQHHPFLYHTIHVHGCEWSHQGIETDRARFIGRNRDLGEPIAQKHRLTNSAGAILDPAISIRKRITLPPGGTAVVDSILGIHNDRSTALLLMERFGEKTIADRILELAWTHGHVLLQQMNCSAAEALLYGKMASSLIYGGSNLRAQVATIKANVRPLSSLWSYGISGDYPIVLLRLFNQYSGPILQQTLRAHDYWRRKGLIVDLVIWNEDRSGYRQDLNESILEAIAATGSTALLDKHGGIYIRRPDQMPDEDRIIFQAAARIIISDQAGTLEEQVDSARHSQSAFPKSVAQRSRIKRSRISSDSVESESGAKEDLLFDNGLGGFRQDGKEYVLTIGADLKTPMPWVNVLANPVFGTLVSESGSAYTWSENAHEHRLTPWFNDPVVDPSGEALFIRDEVSGEFWTSTPSPRPGVGPYTVRHGFGYSSFETATQGIHSVMTTFVAVADPIKVILIKLSNETNQVRNLSLTVYFELVLGEHRSRSSSQIVSEFDSAQNIIYGRNIFASDFRDRIAFLSSTVTADSYTGDRSEFIGRNRSLKHPAAMDHVALGGQVGALFDPCLAMQVACEIRPGETREVAFVFGLGRDLTDARRLSRAFRSMPQIQLMLDNVHQKWNRLLSRISIQTPDPAIDVLANGWLLYQTISSRIWGRTGFYQSGGAYGFRDQLQDMMAVVYCAPEIVREHIIRCASRQFVEGDVQHWWHPPMGRGVRTKISDDYLWLPFVTQHYIQITGDLSVLGEKVNYLTANLLRDGAESDYSLPLVAEERGNVYEHCVKALQYGMKFGAHGLPLMGSGDWNDGMNQVGIQGRGESVWLGFFLFDCLIKFAGLAERQGDLLFAASCQEQAVQLKTNIEKCAWDGAWYRRAYFDDGSVLGSAQNQECRIDSLPQSWSILSGAATGSRGEQGLRAVYEHLVRNDLGIIKLFDPPFDKQLPNPGYISGYLQGVRENGGQYTHAALWVIMAFAQLGEVDRALELLQLINPVILAGNGDGVSRYKIEPYVIAGDVYAAESHGGRGGWSWYTGSAAWFYRAIVETFIGFDLRGDTVRFTPRLPKAWPLIRFDFLHRATPYQVLISRGPNREGNTRLDGKAIEGLIHLVDDQKQHQIEIVVSMN